MPVRANLTSLPIVAHVRLRGERYACGWRGPTHPLFSASLRPKGSPRAKQGAASLKTTVRWRMICSRQPLDALHPLPPTTYEFGWRNEWVAQQMPNVRAAATVSWNSLSVAAG